MLDKKWKWVAKDDAGEVYLYSGRPERMGRTWAVEIRSGTFGETKGFQIEGDWKDSLHEIIHHEDGKIEFRKAHPELKVDDPVWVKNASSSKWFARHFSVWDVATGKIRCWDEGRTSFTASGFSSVWEEYKLP